MKNILCYILTDKYSDRVIVRKNISEIAELLGSGQAFYYLEESPVEVQYEDNEIEKLDLKPYIKQIELTPEKIKEIEDWIDKQIEGTERAVKSGMANISGFHGFYRKDRQKYINQCIEVQSHVWSV